MIKLERLELEDLFEVDSGLKNKFDFIKNTFDFNGIDIEATVRSLSGQTVTILPGKVSMESKEKYLKLATQFKLGELNKTVEIIRSGIARVVPLPLLSLFTAKELGALVTGEIEIPIQLLQKVTVYKGIAADSEFAFWFWQVLTEMSRDDRQLFLRFVWGRTRLPRSIGDFRGRDFVLQVLNYQTILD